MLVVDAFQKEKRLVILANDNLMVKTQIKTMITKLDKSFRNKSSQKSFTSPQITVSKLFLLKNTFKINTLLHK